MKAAELNKLSVEELNAKLKELKEELFNLRFQLAINQLDNPHKITAVKKDIARVMTILQEKYPFESYNFGIPNKYCTKQRVNFELLQWAKNRNPR